MTEVKLVKQQVKEIKEDNSIDIDEQNIAEMVNLRDFHKPLTDFLVTDINDSNNNKIVKQISKLDFEKDVINEFMEIFNVKQKAIDQIKKEFKSTTHIKLIKEKGNKKR